MEIDPKQLTELATQYGVSILGGIVILIIGRIIAGLGRRIVRNILTRNKTDEAVVSFFGSLVYILILAGTVLAALGHVGVETASFIAIIGAAGFAIGFALQGSLANFAAGVLILVFRPFKVGDFIDVAGVAGSVKEIHLFTTVLATPDNIKIMVPNGQIYGNTIKNITAYDTRRCDLLIGIAYGSSIQKAEEIVESLIKQDERILTDPEPMIAVAELADSSVNLHVRPWVATTDYWAVRFDLTRKIKEAFDANGIEIPFPQRVVHMVQEEQN
jgi:small conductance mechanosensitive channel